MRVCASCGEATADGFRVCRACGSEDLPDESFNSDEVGPEKKGGPTVLRLTCPRCEGSMREGFLSPKHVTPLNQKTTFPQVGWHGGPARWSAWWGQLAGDVFYPIQAFRCEGCGYLEFYANPSGR